MPPSRRKGSKAAAAAAARREWKVGDLVLAKVKGFQAWPAMVSEPEKWGYAADWKKVLVCFFGTQQIAFCNPADVEAFTEEKKQRLLGKRHGKYSEFGRALIEIVDTFDKLKKGENSNDTDEDTMVSENNTSDVLKIPVSGDKSPITTVSQQRISLSSGTHNDVNDDVDVEVDDMKCNESINEKDVALKEDGSSMMGGTERSIITTYSTRRRSQRTQASRSSMLRRHPSARHSRRSSRVEDVIDLQSVSEPSGSKNLRDVPSRLRIKRMRESPDIDGNEVDSPDVVSDSSTEGNDSGIVTADSDAISFNEGSTNEPVPVADLVQPDIKFSQRLEFQTNNIIIHKKKRRPKRKRPIEESVVVCTEKLDDERVASDSDVKIETIPEKLASDNEVKSETILEKLDERMVVSENDVKSETILEKLDEMVVSNSDFKSETIPEKLDEMMVASDSYVKSETIEKVDERVVSDSDVKSETVLRSYHDRSPEWCSKENGDKHLPLSKRARARILLSPSEDKLQEESHILSDQVSQSLHQESIDDNGDVGKSSPLHKHSENMLLCEVKTTAAPPDSSLDVEAALPPLKRLHRALGVMSVNADEDNKISVDKPLTKTTGSSQNHSSSSDDSYNSTERNNDSELRPGKEDENFNKNSVDSPKDGEHCSVSPKKEIQENTAVFVECCKSLSPPDDFCKQVDHVTCSNGSPYVATMPSNDQCKTMSTLLTEPCAEINVQSLDNNGSSVLEDCANDTCKTTKPCDLTDERCKDPGLLNGGDNVAENETTGRGSGPSSLIPSQVMVDADLGHSDDHSLEKSVSDYHSLDKSVSVSQSSSSLTDGLDSVSHATPHTLAGNTSASDDIAIQFNGSCSPGVHSHLDVEKRASKLKNIEAQGGNLASFEAILETLTRGKECIGRATRLAIELSKYGLAAKVVEAIACNLEKESSLHRRVDLFFLVDSIAQSSKGLKGDIGGVYPSAILAVLPRLLSAAAPPGSSSRENRRQCLKVLRVWHERRILPESITRHHIRELDSLCGSSCSRTSSRAFRKERPMDDPIREMEGMLVDEYGSNSSLQLAGFCMPRLMRDEGNDVDSDGESFEALTPEHNAGKPEVNVSPVVEKHRHILEDVDGELEMEDVAPVEATSNNLQIENSVAAAAVAAPPPLPVDVPPPLYPPPPLPVDVPPLYPPLPTSPPPPPPLPPLPPPPVRSQVPNPPANCSNFNDRANRSTQTDVKGFRLPPPHPAPSNHFSYVQNERRDPPPHFNNSNNRFHTENGSVYRDRERTNFPPYGVQEHWRAPPHPFPGTNYPDSSGNHYPPASFPPQHCEPSRSQGMNHQEFMHHGPPAVSSRGANNYWRPR